MTLAIVVGLAGSVGAITRFLVDGAVQDRVSGSLPFGTLTVNVSGSFVLGVVTGLVLYHGLAHPPLAVVGTGFCGGLTTWSAASWETVRLAEEGQTWTALLNVCGGLAASFAAAALGLFLAGL